MNLPTYWQLPPDKQEAIIAEERNAELEREAAESQMLVYKGKLIKPEDYPCTCELADPSHCFQDGKKDADYQWSEEERASEQCHCPCHRYHEPW